MSTQCVDLLTLGVCWLCGFEIDCMKKWYAKQETSGICEGLIAELVQACEWEQWSWAFQSCVLRVLSVSTSKWGCLCRVTVWRPIALNFAAPALRRERFWTARCRFMCLAKSPSLGKRCWGQSWIQDGAGMRSCFPWIVVGGHSVAFWRSVCCCRLTIVGLRRVLSVSVRGIGSQG